jgi:hypothetical protein
MSLMYYLDFSLHFKFIFQTCFATINLNLCTKSVKVLDKHECRENLKKCFLSKKRALLKPFYNDKCVNTHLHFLNFHSCN